MVIEDTDIIVAEVVHISCRLGYFLVRDVAARAVDISSICEGINRGARRAAIIAIL